jgi:hypothetical protein
VICAGGLAGGRGFAAACWLAHGNGRAAPMLPFVARAYYLRQDAKYVIKTDLNYNITGGESLKPLKTKKRALELADYTRGEHR